MFDDMISTASSICGAAKRLKEAGARKIYVGATHGVLCGPAIARISEAPDRRSGDHRHDPADARAHAPQDQGAVGGAPAWARRSSGFTAKSR